MSKTTFRRKNPRYLLKQGNVWYVQYQIPKDVRHDSYFLKEDGTQLKQLWQTTKTPDQKDAEILAAKYVAEYKAEVHRVRTGKDLTTDERIQKQRDEFRKIENRPIHNNEEYYEQLDLKQDILAAAYKTECDRFIDGGFSRVKQLLDAGRKEGNQQDITINEVLESLKGGWLVIKSIEALRSDRTPFLIRIDQYKLDRTDKNGIPDRNFDHALATILSFAERFPILQDITKKEVKQWIFDCTNGLNGEKQVTPQTIDRKLSEIRPYWRYLQEWEEVSEELEPFNSVGPTRKNGRSVKMRDPYTDDEAIKLQEAARQTGKRDPNLEKLIMIGMYTGARLAEIMNLRVEEMETHDGVLCFHFNNHVGDNLTIRGKTPASTRVVPVHSQITHLVEMMTTDSTDGYLFENVGEDKNKYGDRSQAISKRFTRLKRKERFGPRHVFHSYRHTVETKLGNRVMAMNLKGASIDDVIDRLLGHESGIGKSEGMRAYMHDYDVSTLKKVVELIDYTSP